MPKSLSLSLALSLSLLYIYIHIYIYIIYIFISTHQIQRDLHHLAAWLGLQTAGLAGLPGPSRGRQLPGALRFGLAPGRAHRPVGARLSTI